MRGSKSGDRPGKRKKDRGEISSEIETDTRLRDAELEAALLEARAGRDEAVQKAAALGTLLREAQRERDALAGELAEMRRAANAERTRADTFQQSVTQAEAKLFSARHELEDLRALHSRKLQRLAEFEDDREALARKLAAQELTLAELAKQARARQADARVVDAAEENPDSAAIAELQALIAEEQSRNAELSVKRQRALDGLMRATQQYGADIEALTDRLEQRQAALAALEADHARVVADRDTIRAGLVEGRREAALVSKQLDDARRTLEGEARKNAELIVFVETYRRREQDREVELAGVAAALADARRRAEQTERQIEMLKRSVAFKLLAPAMSMKRGLSRLRARLFAGATDNPLFDAEYYVTTYPEVAESGMDPYAHYLAHGAREGRNPNAMFDSGWYLERYADVRDSGINPLVHYLTHGAMEARDPHPLFSTTHYLGQHPELKQSGVNPLQHYLQSLKTRSAD